MQATLHYSAPSPVKPRRAPVRRGITIEELLRRATASVERGQVKLIPGSFRPVVKGRPLTRLERNLMLLIAAGLGLAIWLHAKPAPISAHTAYYQSLALSTRLDSTSPRVFTESALLAVGSEWRPATLFACVHPAFWSNGPAVQPDTLAKRIEGGLARLAGHGPVVSATAFALPAPIETETINGALMLTCRVAGQLELADGVVVRFAAHLVQDGPSKQWSIVDLSVPQFLP